MSESASAFEQKPSSWHISVAVEGVAAAQFARCGFDVSVQYGADQPEYDLIVARGDQLLKVSAKGSQDWDWGLTQSFLKQATKRSGMKADYQGAIDLWLERHRKKTVSALCSLAVSGSYKCLACISRHPTKLQQDYGRHQKGVEIRSSTSAKNGLAVHMVRAQLMKFLIHGSSLSSESMNSWRMRRPALSLKPQRKIRTIGNRIEGTEWRRVKTQFGQNGKR
jgi:hypothetical protein